MWHKAILFQMVAKEISILAHLLQEKTILNIKENS